MSPTAIRPDAPPDRRRRLPARWPIVAPLIVLAIALLLRTIDVFVLRLDERLGEIILSKALGFALVVAYVWWVRRRLPAIGMHHRQLGAALAIGVGVTAAAFTLGGIVQQWIMPPGSAFTLQPVDPKTGAAGGVAFALLLIVGNAVNSSMEEGLFRGLMLPHFLQRLSFRRANLLQASLFALWHLVWPVKSYLTRQASAGGALAEAGNLLVATGIPGPVYGYLYWRTDSLWSDGSPTS